LAKDEEMENKPLTSRIFQINISDGGVPKLGIRRAEVTPLGISGDRQRDTRVHGGPDRAVCIYSLERILDLQSEGHPIFPGSIGENLTLSGLDWPKVTPGTRLRLGADVLVEVTKYTSPCDNIAESFTGKKFNRILESQHAGWSRVYARVLRPGTICPGDVVAVD
jgi:MOSC domain-containing protein YiiM